MACLLACLMASLIRYADADEAPVGTCLKDEQLRDRLQLSTSVGFAYTIEGTDAKMKPGIVGRKPGDVARFCLDALSCRHLHACAHHDALAPPHR